MAFDLDLRYNVFSRYGSYMSISRPKQPTAEDEGLWLRQHRGRGVSRRDLFRLDALRDGRPVAFSEDATSATLTLRDDDGGEIAFCIEHPDTLRIRGDGAGLRLEMPMGTGIVAHPGGENRWVVNARPARCRCMFEPLAGRIDMDAPWGPDQCDHVIVNLLPDESGHLDVAMDLFQSTWRRPNRGSFDRCVERVSEEFQGWLDRSAEAPRRLRSAWEHAAYVNWSAVVLPEGLLTRPSMFMSKRVMDQVWSWDHCFNAMAMSHGDPKGAFDQWMIMPDQQDEFGAFPDGLNPWFRHFNYSKPPVHGWALRFCMQRNPAFFTKARLREAYGPLAKWSQWWLEHRTMPGETLPFYLHGNDSGWDNSTMFDHGAPLVSPDLATFLAVQLEVLAELAQILGRKRDAAMWRKRSDELVAALIHELWRDDHFIARRQHDGFEVHCDSLVLCMPILLARRLPTFIRNALTARIEQFLTDHGVATELPDGPLYTSDGYWRGPIWAPSTMLIVDGLFRSGNKALGRTIARRFCDLCAKSAFAENFDALTGENLRDPAYTWTSSVFLVLAHDYL